ncbi:MAG TPA: helix-turn-helix transcriptional regulator [Gemmatimonadales bacterium]|nr:helix-turn-helix transcriptional regulator [Gemmatimonadales bacterium]
MSIHYHEYPPGGGLGDAVRCYWTIRADRSARESVVANRVLPDNCIDVIFDFAPATRHPALLVGPMLSAEVFLHGSDVDLLGVRFRPGAATEFLDIKASDLTPRHLEAAMVWRDAASLTERLREAQMADRRAVLDLELGRRRRTTREAGLARLATVTIERARGMMTVSALTRALGVGERRLERSFETAVGIGPKQVLRVERFRGAAWLIARHRDGSLSRIAATCGYADQAHLTREFAAFAGVTPTAFRTERHGVGFLQDGSGQPP